jgi:hypothetical protein
MLYSQPISSSLIKENDANKGDEGRGGGRGGEEEEGKEEKRLMAEFFQQNIMQSTFFKF